MKIRSLSLTATIVGGLVAIFLNGCSGPEADEAQLADLIVNHTSQALHYEFDYKNQKDFLSVSLCAEKAHPAIQIQNQLGCLKLRRMPYRKFLQATESLLRQVLHPSDVSGHNPLQQFAFSKLVATLHQKPLLSLRGTLEGLNTFFDADGSQHGLRGEFYETLFGLQKQLGSDLKVPLADGEWIQKIFAAQTDQHLISGTGEVGVLNLHIADWGPFNKDTNRLLCFS